MYAAANGDTPGSGVSVGSGRKAAAMQGIVLTQCDDLSTFLTTIRGNHIPLLKIVSGWGWHWDSASIAHVCQTMPDLMVRTVSGDGCRPPPPGQGTIFLEPSVVQSELSPWLNARPDCWCELGNEPNMYDSSDEAAWVFRYWCLETVNAMRAQFPAARLVAPGLTANRQFEWWNICQDAFRRCDAIGFHAYSHYDADDTGDLGRAFAQLPQFFPQHPWILTEYGIHDPVTAPEIKATRYGALYHDLPPEVRAACWYHYADDPLPGDADQAAYALPPEALPYLESEDVPMAYTSDTTTYDKAKKYPVYHGYATRPSAPTTIVVHSTEGAKGQTLKSAADYLFHSPDVSADFLIGKGSEIIQFLDSRVFQAWHAGGQQDNGSWTAQPAYANPHSIGIECLHANGETWPDAQKATLAWLLDHLVHTYGIPPLAIETHGQIAIAGPYQRKSDPTNWPHSEFLAWRDALFVQPKHYRVAGLPVYQASDRTGALWGHLHEGEQVVIDDPTNGHLADHRGFVDINGLAPA